MKTKQFVVFGLGRFGSSVATTLAEAGYEVMAVDKNEEKVQDIAPIVTQAVQADVSDADIFKELGIRNFDVAVIAMGSDMQSSIMATLMLKEMGMPYVVAKASTPVHKKVLEKLGADRIVSPEKDMGKRIATNLISGNVIDYIQLSEDYSIMEISILEEWIGRTIKDLNIRAKYGINIIAVESNNNINVSPAPDYVIGQGDLLVVVGKSKAIQELEEKSNG